MKKLVFTFSILLTFFFLNEAHAQKYNSAVGVRGGYNFAGTYKKFINETNAFEVYAGLAGYRGGIYGGALYQIHKPLDFEGIENLDWYYGGGAYAGLYSSYYGYSSNFYVGINLNIGLDYKFDEFPVNVSMDWAPGINFVGGFRPSFVGGGIAVRYILGQ